MNTTNTGLPKPKIGVAAFVLIIYWILVVLPHEWVGVTIATVSEKMSREMYNLSMMVIFSCGLIGWAIWAYPRWRRMPDRRLWMVYLCMTLILTWAVSYYLMIVKVELIHILQYAIFALLCYRVVPHYFSVFCWTILAGTFDELYQYLILSPERTDYFDLNDVVINTVGALYGILTLHLLGRKSRVMTWRRWFRTPLVAVLVILLLVILTFSATGHICFGQGASCVFVLYKVMPESFWEVLNKGQIIYHILRWWEFVIVMCGIFFLYRAILLPQEPQSDQIS